MNAQDAMDGKYVENPEDHLGIIYVETKRLMDRYSGLEFEEVLSELYIILERCCRYYKPGHDSYARFSTYAHAACRISRATVIARIDTGKKSHGQHEFNRKAFSLDESWDQTSPGRTQFDEIDDLDEIDHLLEVCSLAETDALIANAGFSEPFREIGARHDRSRSAAAKWKNNALRKIRDREAAKCN